MIPYEQLAAALEDYAARVHGRAPTGYAPVVAAAPVAEPHDSYDADTSGAAHAHEEPGALPAAPVYADHGEGHEEHTLVGGVAPSTIRGDEPSNEIDIGDVLDDESQA